MKLFCKSFKLPLMDKKKEDRENKLSIILNIVMYGSFTAIIILLIFVYFGYVLINKNSLF